MGVSDTEKNRGAHGDSSFKLGGMPPSSENPTALAVGSVKDVFTTRLKKSINERGLTQRMLATLIGTTEQSVSRWANGNRTPNADMLYRMCKALDVSADYLLGLSEERANNMEKLKAELLDKIKKLWDENNATT